MADSARNSSTSSGAPLQNAQSSVVALFLLMATAAGVLNMSPAKPGAASSGQDASRKSATAATSIAGPPARADFADALEALEPLTRFLNLSKPPGSLEEFAQNLKGYRLTTLIATLSDPKDSRLGYDFDMSLEAIQRAIESEGYTLDRFRLPWVDGGTTTASGLSGTTSSTPPATPPTGPTASASNSPTAGGAAAKAQGPRYERQPGTILYRIDRKPGNPGEADPPQDLLLLMIVGETPTWGVQSEALQTSLNIAWLLDTLPNQSSLASEREPVIRILGPTFSGTADSIARGIKRWAQDVPSGREARIWVCSGAATAVGKPAFERLCLPARVIYSATVIPDEILLRAVYRYLAKPSSRGINPNAPTMPMGTIALLVEGGSGYGSAVAGGYGTNSSNDIERRIITIPFPGQINQIRIVQANQDSGAGRGRVTIPLDPPSGRISDHIPSLSPQMTVATDSLIMSDILGTISNEEVRYVGIVATDILDVMFLTKLIRDNCPDVQIFLVGNDLRYTDPQFTLDFRGTIIASSYPLDSRAQVWSFPFKGNSVRRLFASEFDIGRYNAGLVLLNAHPNPEDQSRLIIEPSQAEDLIAYGKPFAATSFDSFNRRPQIWINQVGQDDLWPLKVVPISRIGPENRKMAEDLIPAVVSLDPQQDQTPNYHISYDFPLGWKLIVVALSLIGLGLVGMIGYANLSSGRSDRGMSWFTLALSPFRVVQRATVERHWFFLTALNLTVLVPYCSVVGPLDLLLSSRAMEDAKEADLASLFLEPHLYFLAALSWVTLIALLIPPVWAVLNMVSVQFSAIRKRRRRDGAQAGSDYVPRPPMTVERLSYFVLTILVAVAAIACVVSRIYRFTIAEFELPNDWLVRERGVHLFGGVSPIIPSLFLGGAFGYWVLLELQRLHCHPLLRRGDDLLDMTRGVPEGGRGWAKVVAEMNARFRHSVALLDDPLTALMSRNLPLAGLFATALVAIGTFVFGVIWPRYIATPDGPIFDALFIMAFTAYLMIQLYSLVRFIWLWRSINQLFHQLAVLPIATVFDRLPPVVGQIFGRFLSASRLTEENLKIPMQQCRLLIHAGEGVDPRQNTLANEIAIPLIEAGRPATEVFEAISRFCVPEVVANNWTLRSLESSYGTQGTDAAKSADKADAATDGSPSDAAAQRWLAMAEELLILRIVYLVSQFSAPINLLAKQLIFGPLILLLAATWYPFQPQRLIAMLTWGFIILGAVSTFVVFVRIERDEFVNRVSRTAPNSFFFDKTFLTNLAPYAVPIIGFMFTAFPSLSYWLGSIIEPITRAVK